MLAVFSQAPVSAAMIEESPGNWEFNADPPNPVVDPLIATGGDLITFLAGSGLLADIQFVEAI